MKYINHWLIQDMIIVSGSYLGTIAVLTITAYMMGY